MTQLCLTTYHFLVRLYFPTNIETCKQHTNIIHSGRELSWPLPQNLTFGPQPQKNFSLANIFVNTLGLSRILTANLLAVRPSPVTFGLRYGISVTINSLAFNAGYEVKLRLEASPSTQTFCCYEPAERLLWLISQVTWCPWLCLMNYRPCGISSPYSDDPHTTTTTQAACANAPAPPSRSGLINKPIWN